MEAKLTANELRIGNLINTFEMILPVDAELILAFEKNIDYLKLYKPIPLTEELLVKFGFEKALNGWWCPNELISYRDGYIGFGIDRLTKIKYVHELQNLYFALIGEELQFNK